MKFSSYTSHQEELAEERFAALVRVVEAGNSRQADVLVVAGDLFHRVGVASHIVERAVAILARFTGALVLVLPGNHDYLAPEGDRLWTAVREAAAAGTSNPSASNPSAAADSIVVLDRPGSFDLSRYDLPLTVLAAPCDAQHGASHRLGWATGFEPPRGHLVLGVAHGSIDGLTLDSEGHYFPMPRKLLASIPADVWIVGHTHGYHDVADARIVVPGAPEADGFDSSELGSAAFVTLDAGSTYAAEPVATGRYRFYHESLTIDDPDGSEPPEALAARVRAALPDGDVLVRLAVAGLVADDVFEQWNAIREELVRDPRVMRVDDTELRRVLSREEIDRRYAHGSFAHTLLARLSEAGDHEALGQALSIIREVAS